MIRLLKYELSGERKIIFLAKLETRVEKEISLCEFCVLGPDTDLGSEQ